MSSQLNITVRPEVRLDAKWLKTDLQRFLYRDGLAELWNEMVRDGEIVGSFSDGLINAAGIVAKKGMNIKINYTKCKILFTSTSSFSYAILNLFNLYI